MSWFKVDDGLHGHPKARAAGLSALGLWVVGGSFTSHQLLDGHVPAWQVTSWAGGKRAAEQLVEAGLWLPDSGGYQFHEWTQSNPTRAQVMAARDKAKKRQQRWRDEHGRDDDTPEGEAP
jgi:hypothetical protein